MDSERWKQVDDILQAVLDLAPEERDAFLRQACAGDKALEREVRSLLTSKQKAGNFLETPAIEVVARAAALDQETELLDASGSLAGRTISHYRIIEKLGQGGMGVVWKAFDTRLDRFVALKLLAPAELHDPERKRRFVQEAKAASALNHPNVITVYEIGRDGPEDRQTDFIAMEFVPGKPLHRIIPVQGLPLDEALHFAVQVADALCAAHAAGIVHRDLKPGNVMVNEDRRVKLLDFGLAKLAELSGAGEFARTAGNAVPETGTGVILGTVSYMSPEQAEGKKVDARTDIFSFGAILYEMVTGRRAFTGDSIASILAAILRDEPNPAAKIVHGLPHELERIIARCLRKDPARRFQTMAELKLALEDLKEGFDPDALARVAEPRRRRLPALGWIAGAGMLAGVLAGWLLFSPSRLSQYPPTAVPLTTYPGSERNPTFSPDGSQVAFSWDGDKQDNFDIYVKLIGAGPPLRLTTDPAEDFSPAWSPDGQSIAFLRRLPGGKAAVMLISPLGGPERQVAETDDVNPLMYDASGSLSWSPDSKSLAILGKPGSGEPVSVFLLSVETGERRRLTKPPPKIMGDSGPAFSPDGRMLAFTRSTGTVVNDLYVQSLSGTLAPDGEPRRLTFDNRRTYGPAWMPDGRQLIFCSNRAGIYSLWRIPVRGGKQPVRLESFGEDGFSPTISRDGHRLMYARRWSNINIWRIDLAGVHRTSLPAPLNASVLIASSRQEMAPAISPDGKKIAFASYRTGFPEIWLCDSNGSNQVPLTSFAAYSGSPSWSPDGKLIAFDCNASGHFELYVMKANGARPTRLTNGEGDNAIPHWSRNGKWIYFRSRQTGQDQIWKIPAAGGTPVQVTTKGGFLAVESADGAFLYYTKTDQVSGLWKMPVAGGAEIRLLDTMAARAFALVEDGIYFFTPGLSHSSSLQFFSFITNQATTLGTAEKPPYLYIDVSPDKRWLLYSQQDQRVENLMLVEHFD